MELRESLNGWKAMHLAAIGGHIECVARLIEFGAKRDPADEFGDTPLDCVRANARSSVKARRIARLLSGNRRDDNDDVNDRPRQRDEDSDRPRRRDDDSDRPRRRDDDDHDDYDRPRRRDDDSPDGRLRRYAESEASDARSRGRYAESEPSDAGPRRPPRGGGSRPANVARGR